MSMSSDDLFIEQLHFAIWNEQTDTSNLFHMIPVIRQPRRCHRQTEGSIQRWRCRTSAQVNITNVVRSLFFHLIHTSSVFFVSSCRGHRNDLENILPFLVVGLFYVLTNPAVTLATLLFKVVAIARIVHTIVYTVVVIPQPARALAWFVPYGITAYMAVKTILYVLWIKHWKSVRRFRNRNILLRAMLFLLNKKKIFCTNKWINGQWPIVKCNIFVLHFSNELVITQSLNHKSKIDYHRTIYAINLFSTLTDLSFVTHWQLTICTIHFSRGSTLFELQESQSKMSDSNILHLLDYKNPVFVSYIFWSCILLLKTLGMSAFTTFYRSKNKVNTFVYFV